jgi:hypothetical protein
MGRARADIGKGKISRTRLGACTLAILLPLLLSAPARAVPFHARAKSLDVAGLNHACGTAVDSQGDLYLSSAGESKVKVYDPTHKLLTEISDANSPCGLAVTTTGALYISERATGEVVRFKPSAYPFVGTPTYGSREVIDASGKAKGIAVDPADSRLYVAEGTKVAIYTSTGSFEANAGEGILSEASGVASYTFTTTANFTETDHYLWVADAKGLEQDRLYLLAGTSVKALALRRELNGAATPSGSFGFGAAGAYLTADPGNRNSKGECKVVGEQACTAGHIFLYDAAHKALDEFDASGEYLDRARNAAFADAEPTAIAIDRSGGANDGTLYVTAGKEAGAKALAFAPLKAPSRETLGEPVSHVLKNARAVATDSHGDVYAGVEEGLIHVYAPGGKQLVEFNDTHKAIDLAVDSSGKVYVLDENAGFIGEEEVTYYTPSKYPPEAGTTYTRHEPAVATREAFPNPTKENLQAIAVNPGPSEGKDHLFVSTKPVTREYESAANESGVFNEEFAPCAKDGRQSIAVDGVHGIVWIAENGHVIYRVNEAGECLGRLENTGLAKFGSNPYIGVDQSDGHLVTFDGATSTAREYDGSGAFVAAFGNFTENITRSYRVAVDSACAIHEPPLSGKACQEFDPANGNAYVAWDDPNASHPPFDLTAFGPLKYPEPANHKLTVEKKGTGSGKVTSEPAGIECGLKCSAEFPETEVVVLTAEADGGSTFSGWEGCEAEPSPAECEVTTSEDKKVKTDFESGPPEEELKVIVEGPGEVTSEPAGIECPSECTAFFGNGVKVKLTAEADVGAEFVEWKGACSGTEPTCEVTMSEDREVTAKFDVEHPELEVHVNGPGEVSSEPPGIECPPTCSEKFDLNKDVTLTAVPDEGGVFEGWEGCDSEPSETECEVAMEEARQVAADFAALPKVRTRLPQPILYTEATLRGEVDPSGLPTEYRFEYLTAGEYEANGDTFEEAQHTAMKKLPAGEAFVAVAAPVVGLEEGAEYRFRLRAMNSVGPAEDEGAFETLERRPTQTCPNSQYRVGLSANLPDCRAYELVTPAQTDGLAPLAVGLQGSSPSGRFNKGLTVQRGEAAGERLSYFTFGTLPGFEGNGTLDGYRAERGTGQHPAGGWQSELFSPDYTQAAPGIHGSPFQIGVAPDQLYSVWEANPEPETFPDTLPQGVYLRTPTGFEALARGSLGEDPGALSRYVSAGGQHVIFSSKDHLEPAAPPAKNVSLYDRPAGVASSHVLNVPPAGASTEEEAEFAGAIRSKEQTSYQGQSEDGGTVAFKAGVTLYASLSGTSTERITPRRAQVGDTLKCAAGPLYDGQQELERRRMQWLRNGTPVGASGNDVGAPIDYAVKPADEGTVLQCFTVATDFDPRSVAVSTPIWIAPLEAGQAPQPPAQIAAPAPSNPGVGTVEACNPGSWGGAESFAYQWYADGEEIAGATAQTYKVQAADVPGTLQCMVRGTNTAAAVARASGLTPTSPAPAEAAPVATAQAAPETVYAGASEDGRYVFYAMSDGKSPGRLLRFDTQAEASTEIGAIGLFAGVSADGSHALFSSTEALTSGEENDNEEAAEEGAHNLYAWDDSESIRFIGRLSSADFEQNAFAGIGDMNLAAWTAAVAGPSTSSGRALAPTRASANGDVFVFQSHARLTAYDNEGKGEIYRYDAAAKAGERLLCVSCDPSGAPPSADALLEDVRGIAGVPNDASMIVTSLTDDGNRVFFQSFDRLLPEDANEVEDVYEWTAPGAGEPQCGRSTGCLSLISSGQGETPSFLYAMSADGHDVFVQTREKLVGADVAGSPSIYDAREEGGIPEATEPAPCQGDACQGQGSESPVLPQPATTGDGESPEGTQPVRPHCAKGKHRVKGRCVAVKHKHRKRHRRAHANGRGNR